MWYSIPNFLTFGRIGVIPFIVGLFYVEGPWPIWIRTALFILACITDYLDGYVARTYDQVSLLGRFLDPLADKLLVVLTLVMLVGFQSIGGLLLIPVILMIAREIAIPGLREVVQDVTLSLRVSILAKWKTALQMIVLTLFIMDDHSLAFAPLRFYGACGLWMAAFLTLWSGYLYWEEMPLMKEPHA